MSCYADGVSSASARRSVLGIDAPPSSGRSAPSVIVPSAESPALGPDFSELGWRTAAAALLKTLSPGENDATPPAPSERAG